MKNVIPKNPKDKNIDNLESVAEEIKIFTGWNVRIVENRLIELDTIAGRMKYRPSENTVMGDVYRFISHYGSKLNSWGLEHKINEQSKPRE